MGLNPTLCLLIAFHASIAAIKIVVFCIIFCTMMANFWRILSQALAAGVDDKLVYFCLGFLCRKKNQPANGLKISQK
ncbi:hypothetical protein [Moraxella marmotae]|uniref:hypothetical protein n=1 Tax=Moraxella marmotae TaxID=3344520 RepID=UPI0035F3AC1B